jgi:carbonic anhydrase
MSKLKWLLVVHSVLAVLLLPAPGLAQETVTWGYEGDGGPAHWADLNEDYAACGAGTSQSPIDLESLDTTARYGANVQFHYGDSDLTILNNGHTVEVEYETGSWIVAAGRTYNLLQFHFHSPSEHTFGRGAHFDMEMHLVHRSASGSLAVVAVMIREGEANDALASVWEHLPLEVSEEEFRDVEISVDDVLPQDRRAFHYLGSLTTPPCTEGVHWFVLREPIEMSAEQIAQFREALAGSCCSQNNRPTQELNDRRIGLDLY